MQLQLHQELEEENLNKVICHAIKLDEFFQDIFEYSQPYDPLIHPYYATFIIDFEGWKHRCIKSLEEVLATLAKLYYYTIPNEDDDNKYKTVIFWRWRKRQPANEFLRCQYKPTLPGKEHGGTIRELYKFNYGPRSGVLYNVETGLMVKCATSHTNAPSLLHCISGMLELSTTRLADRLSDSSIGSASEQMAIDGDSGETTSTDDDSCTCFEEVEDILYPRAVNSPAAWICNNKQRLDKAQQQMKELHDIRGSSAFQHW